MNHIPKRKSLTFKLFKENMGIKFQDLGLGKVLLDMTHSDHRKKTDKLDFTKIKKFCASMT